MKRSVVVLVLALGCSVCSGAPPAGHPLISEARTRLEALHESVRLPTASGHTVDVPDAMRVTVARSGIHVDVLDLLASAPNEVVAEFAELLEISHFPVDALREVLPLEDFAIPQADPESMPPLDELMVALGEMRMFVDLDEPVGGVPLILHVDREAPVGLVGATVELVHEEMRRFNDSQPFGPLWVAVAVGDSVRALPAAPRVAPVSALDLTSDTAVCAAPLVHFDEPGAALFATPRTREGARVVQPIYYDLPDPPGPEPPWADLLVVRSDKACPWTSPPAEIGGLVASLQAFAPGCTTLTLSAAAHRTWGSLVEPASDLLDGDGLTELNLDIRLRRPENGCSHPLVLE